MKLNNKGFAISTVVYGLSIMGILLIAMVMGTMSANRSNTRQLAKDIEEDLNRYSKTSTSFQADSSASVPIEQRYTVPEGESGWYRIELWGAQGGGDSGGLGAYTSGVIELNEGQTLYFYIGKHNSSGGTGGEETDVRVINGDYTDHASYMSRIMVAGAGGAASSALGGTLYGYYSKTVSTDGRLNSTSDNLFSIKDGTLIGQETDNYDSKTIDDVLTSYTTNVGISGTSSGGDGYIPGINGSYGGSSFISGYAGVRAYNGVTGSIDSNNATYTYQGAVYDDDFNVTGTTTTKYRFVDGIMLAGVNSGDGKAKLEKIVSKNATTTSLPKQNSIFNTNKGTITKVRDCITNVTDKKDFKRLEIVYDGGKIYSPTTSTFLTIKTILNQNQRCMEYTISPPAGISITGENIEELAVWHIPGKKYINNSIFVSFNGGSWVPLKKPAQINDGGTSGTVYQISAEAETINGIRISAYQYNSVDVIPDTGTYYILPVLSENKVLSAPVDETNSSNPVIIEHLQGHSRQKWSIEKITNTNISTTGNEYKIVELARNNALGVAHDENNLKGEINAENEFNSYARNEPQIWNIIPAGNGTYYIKTVVKGTDPNTGMIFPATNYTDYNNKLIIGNNQTETMRFKLIAIEYN